MEEIVQLQPITERNNLLTALKKVDVPEKIATVDRLKKLGLIAASNKVSQAQKLATAYEEFRFIEDETIRAFNQKLREETVRENPHSSTYKVLVFIPLDQYTDIPPDTVLDKLEEAKVSGIFDRFQIAKIQWKEEIKDPLLFGIVDGCTDKFFIAQWDDDISLDDLIFGDTSRAKNYRVPKET